MHGLRNYLSPQPKSIDLNQINYDRDDVLAIIPARYNSKGIPGKNLLPVGGRPLIEWAIEAASVIGRDNVIVSSDGEPILDVARSLKVRTHLRSASASDDTASSESALLEVLDSESRRGQLPENLLFLQCTSPLTTQQDLVGLVHFFVKGGYDTAFTACTNHAFIWEFQNGNAVGVTHEKAVRLRRQDINLTYRENGAAYLMKTEGFLKHQHRFFGRTGIFEMPQARSIEIDSMLDVRMIEPFLERNALPKNRFTAVKAVVFDFDGVFTDNKVYVSQDGMEAVRCSRSDGMGIELGRHAGLPMLIISKEQNNVVSERAGKLQIPVIQGVDDKPIVLGQWLSDRGLGWNEIAYVGNDVNDVDCIKKAGLGVSVADGIDVAKEAADIVLSANGGNGAVREIIELILAAKEALG